MNAPPQFLFHSQVRKDTKEIAEHMQTIVISTTTKQAADFPQNIEDGYNMIKEMQQVPPHVSGYLILMSQPIYRYTGASIHQTKRTNTGSTPSGKISSNYKRISGSCCQMRNS